MMKTQLEKDITAALVETVQHLRVPPPSWPGSHPARPTRDTRSRRTFAPVLAASVAVLALVAGTTWAITALQGTHGSGPTPSPPPMGSTSPSPGESSSTTAEPPALALGRADTILADNREVQLGHTPVVSMAATPSIVAARTSDGQIWEYSTAGGQATAIGRDASAGPVISEDAGSVLWVEQADGVTTAAVFELDRGNDAVSRIVVPYPGCCGAGTVLGMNQHRVLHVATDQGAWVLDLGESGRPMPSPMPSWVPVGGLGDSRLVRVTPDEVIVRHADGTMGWGYIHPATFRYSEAGRTPFTDLWFLPYGVVAVTAEGRLVLVDSDIDMVQSPEGWVRPATRLGGVKAEFDLPAGASVNGVAPERDRDFLADVGLADGGRDWFRCTLRSATCELVAGLEPEDVTPGFVP
jgi:hypothetical protein